MAEKAKHKVENWLAGLGLGVYAATFRQHDIMPWMVAGLSGDELRELGVHSFGHRRRLQEAARELRDARSPPTPADPISEGAAWHPVSFLFAELVEIRPSPDPERRGEILDRFHGLAARVTKAQGGTLALVANARIVACFGYPQTHGQDAESAVRAGLALLNNLPSLSAPGQSGMALRLATATGPTIISNALETGSLLREGAIGSVPNLAQRLLDHAKCGALLICEATHERIGELFETEALGCFELKGFGAPQAVWQVMREARGISRFEAMLRHQKPMPLVGRQPEARILASLLAQARKGEGQIVLVTGEPGSGKSSLVAQALLNQARGREVALVLQCAPHAESVAFYPLRTCLERLLHMERDVAPDVIQRHLTALVREVDVHGLDLLGILNQLLEIPGALPAEPTKTSAAEIRLTLINAMHRVFEALALRGAILVVEDAQWIDPSTSEIIAAIAKAALKVPVVLAITSRLAEMPPWLPSHETRVVRLTSLYPDEISQLVQAVAAPHILSDEQIETLVARASGVPFYAEELTRGLIGQMARRPAGQLADLQIPGSLQDALLARLNHLGAGRRVICYAGVLGRRFPAKLLRMLVPGTPAACAAGIVELERAGLLIKGFERYGEVYEFRHALLRDAVVQMLLRQERVGIHTRAAQIIARSFPEIASNAPQFLATHLIESGQIVEAVLHYEKAAKAAYIRAAYRESLAYFGMALEHNGLTPGDADSLRREFLFRAGRTNALNAVHGYGSGAAAREVAVLAQLAERLGSQRELFALLLTRWNSRMAWGRDLYVLAQQIEDVADPKNSYQQSTALGVRGSTLFFMGKIREAAAVIDRFLESASTRSGVFKPDEAAIPTTILHAMGLRAAIYAMAGQAAKARTLWQRCMALCGDGVQPHWQCMAIVHGCVMLELLEDERGLAELTSRFDGLAHSQNVAFWHQYAGIFAGVAQMKSGQVATGIAKLRDILGELRGIFHYNAPLIIAADMLIRHDALDLAETLLGQLQPYFEIGECDSEAEYHRLQGVLAMRRGAPRDVIIAHWLRGRDVAQQQGNVPHMKRISVLLRTLASDASGETSAPQMHSTKPAKSGSSKHRRAHRPAMGGSAAEKP